jgi:hypothetical protein
MAGPFFLGINGKWFDTWESSADFIVCHTYTPATVIKPARNK